MSARSAQLTASPPSHARWCSPAARFLSSSTPSPDRYLPASVAHADGSPSSHALEKSSIARFASRGPLTPRSNISPRPWHAEPTPFWQAASAASFVPRSHAMAFARVLFAFSGRRIAPTPKPPASATATSTRIAMIAGLGFSAMRCTIGGSGGGLVRLRGSTGASSMSAADTSLTSPSISAAPSSASAASAQRSGIDGATHLANHASNAADGVTFAPSSFARSEAGFNVAAVAAWLTSSREPEK